VEQWLARAFWSDDLRRGEFRKPSSGGSVCCGAGGKCGTRRMSDCQPESELGSRARRWGWPAGRENGPDRVRTSDGFVVIDSSCGGSRQLKTGGRTGGVHGRARRVDRAGGADGGSRGEWKHQIKEGGTGSSELDVDHRTRIRLNAPLRLANVFCGR